MGLVRSQQILVKSEAVYGTDIVPVAVDALLVQEPEVDWPHQVYNQHPGSDMIAPRRADVVGQRKLTFTFGQWLCGYGSVMSAATKWPLYHSLLTACGFKAVWAANNWTYIRDKLGQNTAGTDNATNKGAVTIYLEADGGLYRGTGCRGDFEMAFTLGAPGRISWTMSGLFRYDGPADADNSIKPSAMTATPIYSAAGPPLVQNTTFDPWGDGLLAALDTLGHIRSVTYRARNVVHPRESNTGATATDGLAGYAILGHGSDADPGSTLTFTVESAAAGANSAIWIQRWMGKTIAKAALGGSVNLLVGGAVVGNSHRFQFSELEVVGVKRAKIEGMLGFDLTCRIHGDSVSAPLAEDDVEILAS